MIEIKMNDTHIKLNGHADYAPRGYDIVCCAVSSAWFQLYLWGEKYPDEIEIKDYESEEAKLLKPNSPAAAAIWENVQDALRFLAAELPEYIYIEEG